MDKRIVNTLIRKALPTYQTTSFKRRSQVKLAAEMGPLHRRRRHFCRSKEETKVVEKVKEVSEDEEVGIEKKVEALQRLVPGGESLEMDRLFEETADYIQALQVQVTAMRALAFLFESLEKEDKMAAGG